MKVDRVREIIYSIFKGRYNIDLNLFDKNFNLIELGNINPKIDSFELIMLISLLQEEFKINTITSMSDITSIDELVMFIFNNLDN